jgi:hypothetical protein
MKNKKGWLQCTQCGWGVEVSSEDIDCGDYVINGSCDHCGIGPIVVDWDLFIEACAQNNSTEKKV